MDIPQWINPKLKANVFPSMFRNILTRTALLILKGKYPLYPACCITFHGQPTTPSTLSWPVSSIVVLNSSYYRTSTTLHTKKVYKRLDAPPWWIHNWIRWASERYINELTRHNDKDLEVMMTECGPEHGDESCSD